MSNQKESGVRWFFNITGVLAPAIIIIFIWLPLIAYYFVPNVLITEDMMDRIRQVPTDPVLDEIQRFFDSNKIKDKTELTTSAEMVLQGKIAIPGISSSDFGFPFDAEDLDKKRPGWQLFFARFSIPYVLLSAYEVSGRDDFLMAAKDVILGFALYERSAWLPKGLLWNDHAIADRISVMAKFWKLYRNHPNYQSEVARELFQLAARSAELLAKPAHFTFATNHGVMQNLALWQICIAFPTLPKIEFYKQLALDRMKDQMRFYVNGEGVVLEHSAGYQKVGLKFFEMAFRYLTLLEMPIPEDWKAKYQKAEAFYAQLLRPDGSLPKFGDTGNGKKNRRTISINFNTNGKIERLAGKKKWIPKQPHSLYPAAGYFILWDGLDERPKQDELSQTVVTWSYFPGHAHKHADEMSVLLWSNGYNWWTNIGYWPFGVKNRSKAVSWDGSNAPHLDNEHRNSKRQTKLLSYSWSDSLVFIDLERKGPDEYVARRQVIKTKPNLWIVLDNTFGIEDQRTTTTWTTSHDINLSKGQIPESYILEFKDRNVKLTKFILTSERAKISKLKGSLSPFAGWDIIKPASAIVIEQPANDSWAAAIWLLQESDGESQKFISPPFMKDWKSPENWQIGLPLASGLMSLWREDNRLFLQEDATGTGTRKKIILSEPPKITDKVREIHTAYQDAALKYPRKRYHIRRHFKLTYFILVLFLFQQAFFFIYRRYTGKYYTALRGLSAFGWIAIGSLLFGFYL